MDFEALMKAARGNKTVALEKKEVVLKTKLAPPKKEEKKVDVAAIRKRLKEQQKSAEIQQRKSTETKEKKPVVKTERKQTASQPNKLLDHKSKIVNGKTIRPVKDSKPKYDDKQHEVKHKKFMDGIQKMGQKVVSQPCQDSSKHNDKITKKPSAKPKALVQPPTFKDLMALAEKAKTNPDALLQASSKPNSPKPASVADSKSSKSSTRPSSSKHSSVKGNKPGNTKAHSGNNAQETVKPSSERSNRPITKTPTDKLHSSCKDAAKQAPLKSSQTQLPVTKPATTSQESGNKSKRGPSASNKRPSSSPAGGTEPKRILSESAMAKLAYREGRRPPPPTQAQSSVATNKQKYSKLIAPLQKATTSNTSQIQQSTTSKSKSGVQSSEASQTQGQDNPSAKKKAAVESNATVSAWDRIMGQPKPKEKSRKASNRYILSDDEEDDDLDGFIDDADTDIDYSAAIRDIFGYDKSRYRDEEFDDRSMVAGYADIMKEEVRSAKIGREEDLRDMQLEEEEKKKKRQIKKRKL